MRNLNEESRYQEYGPNEIIAVRDGDEFTPNVMLERYLMSQDMGFSKVDGVIQTDVTLPEPALIPLDYNGQCKGYAYIITMNQNEFSKSDTNYESRK